MQTDTNILTDGEKKMLNALPWPAIVLDDQGMITDTNEEWQNAVKQTGWLFPDSNSDNYFDHCANYVEQGNDYALRLIFTIREVLDGVHQKKELTILSDESSGKKWCQISISSLQKRRPAALLVFTNVTSNRNAQAALRESEEKYSKLLDTFPEKSPERIVSHTLDDESRFSQIVLNNIPGIFLVIDENLSVVQWNNILRHELGYTPEELNQINIIDLFEKSDKAWVRNVLHNIFKTGAGNFIASIHSRRDEVRPYHLYFNKFENEDQLFLVATAVDKTDHLEAESEKERNFELTSQLFENSPLAKVMIEPNGRVSKANRGFRDLFGYTEKEIMGQDVNQLIATGKHILEADEINNQAFKGRSHQQKTVRQNKDKEQIPVILNTVPILHEEEVIAVFGIYVDMRNQISLEQTLQRTILEKDTLLQEVHHRVKNNLAVVAGMLDLQIHQEENEDVIEKLSEVHSRIHAIAEIHETLYQADSMVMIDFRQYLLTMSQSIPGCPPIEYDSSPNPGSESFFHINMNQAVPLGLVIHELIRFSKKNNLYDAKSIQIRMFQTGEQAEISIRGLGIYSKNILKDKMYTSQFILMKTFLEQIDATISHGKNRNEIVIRFQKNDTARGTHNAML